LEYQNERTGKIVVVAHCVLNQNSRVQGLAKFRGVITPIVETLIKNEVGIIQMPCPEFLYMGCKRRAQTKEQYDTVMYRKFCRKIAENIAEQIQEYAKNNMKTLAILGIEGSPTCAVKETTKGYKEVEYAENKKQKTKKVKEKGILIEELQKLLRKMGIKTNFIGIDNENPEKAKIKIKKIMANKQSNNKV